MRSRHSLFAHAEKPDFAHAEKPDSRSSRERGSSGSGIAPWLERQTRDRKVAGSNPERPRQERSHLQDSTHFLC